MTLLGSKDIPGGKEDTIVRSDSSSSSAPKDTPSREEQRRLVTASSTQPTPNSLTVVVNLTGTTLGPVLRIVDSRMHSAKIRIRI